jgi:GPH family glycoside/pentoside/hexuronide:cation symporter
VAAGSLLPVLQMGGFEAGRTNDPDALHLLSLLYGALPCVLKLLAILLLATTQLEERRVTA